MAVMVEFDSVGSEPPEIQCSECDVIFYVVWTRNAYTRGIEFCPFCGDEIDDFIKG